MSDPTTQRAELLRQPSVRWMMSGAFISNLGDQFTLIALPWLVLMTTGDPLKMGLIIALASVPRAVFILFGGAMVDRYSPKTVLMLTKYVNTVLWASSPHWSCWVRPPCPPSARWHWGSGWPPRSACRRARRCCRM